MEYLGYRLRQELKYYINDSDYHTLRSHLSAVADPDPNMADPEGYLVTSVYFDDIHHSSLTEKEAGYQFRKKFRIRCYNRSGAPILLECKRKYGEYVSKESVPLSRREYEDILSGEYGFLLSSTFPLCRELYARHHTQLGGCGKEPCGSPLIRISLLPSASAICSRNPSRCGRYWSRGGWFWRSNLTVSCRAPRFRF